MNPRKLLSLIVLLLVLGCGVGVKRPDGSTFKGSPDTRTAAILTGATKVEVFRIDGGEESPGPKATKPGDVAVDGYPVLARGKDQNKKFAAKLADILSDEKTYTDQFSKCFWPGVAFRVWKGDDSVDVVICFKCQNFYLGPTTDEEVMETASFSGSPNASRLVRLAKEALPDDKEIQALENK